MDAENQKRLRHLERQLDYLNRQLTEIRDDLHNKQQLLILIDENAADLYNEWRELKRECD